MGHKDIKMTMKHSHLSKTHVDSAVEVLGKNLAQIRHNIDSVETETIEDN